MCDPISMGVATFAISGVQSVLGYVAQSQESKATQKAALEANAQDQNALTLRQKQEGEALSRKKQQINIEEAQKASEVQASAAASGVAGISLDNILADVARTSATSRELASENTRMIVSQISQEKKGSVNTAKSRINSAPKPNPLGLVAGLGGAALGGYNAHNKAIAA